MATSSYLYPYDPTGAASTNKIVAENHTVQPPNNISDASFVIPRAAPFFGDSIIVRTGPTDASTRLEEGKDYYLTHSFVTLAYLLARPIYGSITLINRNYSGDIFITYQTVGGEYVLDTYSIIEERTRSLYNVFMVTWEQVAGNFPQLPPYDHKMAGDDVVGFGSVVDSINGLAAAIAAGGGGTGGTGGSGGDGSYAALQAHMNANTGHTKAQVGLSNVDNYKTANEADVLALSTRTFMTPAMTKYYLDNTVFVTQLQTARQDITELKTRSSNIENKNVQYAEALILVNQTLTSLAESQDIIREDIDDLVEDIATALAPFEGVPTTVERHATNITDLTNRMGLVETKQGTFTTDIDALKTSVETIKTDIASLRLLRKVSPRILTVDDLATITLGIITIPAKRKVRITVVGENRQAETTSKGFMYVLTNSAGIHRSISAATTLAPYVTVESAKATVNLVTNESEVEVSGFLYTAGKVTGTTGVTVTDHTGVNGRSPDPINDEYGDTLTKLADFKVNNASYPISANAIYNEATPMGVPSTGIGTFDYENTNDFEVRVFFKGAFSVITMHDITDVGSENPFTFVYPS